MKVYYPIRYTDVVASSPHCKGAAYRVSFGREIWGNDMEHVYKVQMVYDGQVSGRKSPSYPEGTDDLERVIKALHKIKKGGGASGRGLVSSVGGEYHG